MAANEELITEYLDPQAVKAQTDFFVAELGRAKKAYDELAKAKKDLGGATKLTDVSTEVAKAERATQALIKTQNDLIKQKQLQVKLENDILKQQALQEQQALKSQVAADKAAASAQKKADVEAKAAAKNTSPISITNQSVEDIERTGNAVSELDRKQAEAANSATALGKAQTESAKAAKESIKAFVPDTTVQKNILLIEELNKDIVKNEAAQKSLSQQYNDGKISLSQYQQKLVALKEEQIDNKKAVADLTKETKNIKREFDGSIGSLEGQRAALIRLNQVYDNLSPEERASKSGERLKKTIDATTASVKQLEAETGRNQRNVGNYGSAFDGVTKGATKAFSALRFLANIIPGLGIGGLILALADPIISLTKSLFGFNEVSAKTKKDQEEIASSFKQVADSAGEEISKVTLLKAVLESDNATRLQKVTALKQLKEINVDYFGQLDIENGKVEGLGRVYDSYVTKLIRSINAKANIDLLTKALKEQNEIVGDINKNSVEKDGQFNVKSLTEFQRLDAVRRFNLQFGIERKKGDKTGSILISPEQDQLIVDLLNAEVKVKAITDKIKGDVSDAFDPKKETTKKEKKDGSLQALKEAENTEFERYKVQQNRIIKTFEEIAANEKLSYDERIAALQVYSNSVLELNKKQEAEDIRTKTEAAAREKQRLEEEKKGKDPAQITRLSQNQVIVEKNLQEQLKLIRQKAADDKIEVFKVNEKKFDDITKQENERKIKAAEDLVKAENKALEDGKNERKAILESTYSDDVQFLNQRFADGKISTARYNKERKKLDDQFRIDSLKGEIEYTANFLKLLQLRGINVTKELEQLAKLRKDLSDAQKKSTESDLNVLDKVTASYAVLKDTILGALDSVATKRKNDIEEEIKAIEKRRDIELAANEARIQSDQDRAANATVINARAAAEKEKLERRQKEIDIQKAKAEKALAIFTITLATLKNVASAKDPFSKILAALSGAAQLALAIATPIPKFKHGKGAGNNYEGPAIVNDGSTPEVIQHADGTYTFPEGKNVITHVKRDDIIHPDKDAWMAAMLGAAHRDTNNAMRMPAAKSDDKVGNALALQTKLLKQIADKPTQRTHADRNGLVNVINYGVKEVKYLDNQTNWNWR